jgi:hypothetical protein
MAAFDAAEVTAAVRKLAARHEQLHDRLSHAIGPVNDYHEMSLAQLAQYGLAKLGIEPPDANDDPSVVALENFLHGRAGREGGMGAGMDAGDDNFVTRYINT